MISTDIRETWKRGSSGKTIPCAHPHAVQVEGGIWHPDMRLLLRQNCPAFFCNVEVGQLCSLVKQLGDLSFCMEKMAGKARQFNELPAIHNVIFQCSPFSANFAYKWRSFGQMKRATRL